MKSTKTSEKYKDLDLYAHQALSTDDFLRKIYIVGYNSKALTKTLAKTIPFDKEANKIICLVESKEISIRSCGPLLLGLVRIYDKIVRNFLDEVKNVFLEKIEEKKTKRAPKIKEIKEVIEEETHGETEIETIEKVINEKKTYDGLISNYFLTSPLKQGIYSLLAEQTPSRFKVLLSSEKREVSTIEAFRADISRESNIATDLKAPSEIKLNRTITDIRDELFLDENQGDFRNFFQIISGNNKKEGDLIRELLESESRINFELEEQGRQENLEMELKLEEPKFEEEEIKFTSELEEKLNNLKIRSKKLKNNISFPYDNSTSLDNEKIQKLSEERRFEETPVELYKRVK